MNTRLCASLILLRHSKKSFELLLLKRQNNISYGGAHAFPGGILEEPDASAKWLKHLSINRQYQPETIYSPRIDLSMLKIAAIRETYEETGIYLGTGGKIPRPQSAADFLQNCIDKDSSTLL